MILNTLTADSYIGSAVSVQRRFNEHRNALRKGVHSNRHLQRAWDKYGEGNFDFITLITCARAVLRNIEQRCLDELQPVYNIAAHVQLPMLSLVHTKETRDKIGNANRGKKRTPEQIAHLRTRLKGRVLTQETRAKMGASRKGVKRQPRSQETKDKLRKANIGRKHTDEARAKIGDAARGRAMSDETRKKLGESISRTKQLRKAAQVSTEERVR